MNVLALTIFVGLLLVLFFVVLWIASACDPRQFSDRDRQLVRRIAERKDTLSLVLASCVPSIVGNELVKLGLMLGLRPALGAVS